VGYCRLNLWKESEWQSAELLPYQGFSIETLRHRTSLIITPKTSQPPSSEEDKDTGADSNNSDMAAICKSEFDIAGIPTQPL
jgi:hypothetical protein